VPFHPFVKFSASPEVALNLAGTAVADLLAGFLGDIASDNEDEYSRALIWVESEDFAQFFAGISRAEFPDPLALECPQATIAPSNDIAALFTTRCTQVLGTLIPFALNEPQT
jgi:hypothetical protein